MTYLIMALSLSMKQGYVVIMFLRNDEVPCWKGLCSVTKKNTLSPKLIISGSQPEYLLWWKAGYFVK